MPRISGFMNLGRMAICATSMAVFLMEPPHAIGQDEPLPRQGDSRQLPDKPDPRIDQPFRLAPREVSRDSVRYPSKVHPREMPESDAYVTVIENTPIHVMTNAAINSNDAREGDDLLFTVTEDVNVHDVLIIPRGATIHGRVVKSRAAGAFSGNTCLTLKLISLDLEGRTYRLYTYQFEIVGATKKRQTMTNLAASATAGGLMADYLRRNTIGDSTSARKSAYVAKGTAIGAGVGLAVSAAEPGPIVVIPPESQLDFSLASPISVIPVSTQEAERLSKAMYRTGPALYVRGETP